MCWVKRTLPSATCGIKHFQKCIIFASGHQICPLLQESALFWTLLYNWLHLSQENMLISPKPFLHNLGLASLIIHKGKQYHPLCVQRSPQQNVKTNVSVTVMLSCGGLGAGLQMPLPFASPKLEFFQECGCLKPSIKSRLWVSLDIFHNPTLKNLLKSGRRWRWSVFFNWQPNMCLA